MWIVRNSHCEGDSLKQSQTKHEIASLPRNDENTELIELVPDKMPVGKHDKDHIPFTQRTVHLQNGDIVYAFTDGLPDQFGGPKRKKIHVQAIKGIIG